MTPVQPYAYCAGCKKPSWNQRDIGYAKWKWGKYMCLACSPMTITEKQMGYKSTVETQKPHPGEIAERFSSQQLSNDEVSTPVADAVLLEPVYQRSQAEVQAEEEWLQLNRIEDIPL